MKTRKEHLTHFNIAGFTYYEGAMIFDKLTIGTKLKLKLEEENKFDARAVAIYLKGKKLGFIPKSENRIIYKLLKIGMSENLRAIIQQVNPCEHPEKQIMVILHLINKET